MIVIFLHFLLSLLVLRGELVADLTWAGDLDWANDLLLAGNLLP